MVRILSIYFHAAIISAVLGLSSLRADETSAPDAGQMVEKTSTNEPEAGHSLEKIVRDLIEDQKKRQEAEKAKKAADAKKPTVQWTGQLQTDWVMFSQDAASKAIFGDIPNGTVFRRARFGIFGQHEWTEYRIEMDFASAGRPTFLDVYGGIHNPRTDALYRFGHFFEPFSLERMTPNRFMTFLERSLADQAFAPIRNLGLSWRRPLMQQRATVALGLFRTDSDVYGDDTGDLFEHSVTGRATWLPYYRQSTGDRYFLVGGSGSFRSANNYQVRFRAQPEVRIGATAPNVPFFVDTGNIPATHFFLIGTEALWVHGPLSVQAEYIASSVASLTRGALWFQGWYVYLSYFLTGEHRVLRRETAILDRIIPRRPLFRTDPETGAQDRGPGAWEFAIRLSHLDLNSGTIAGGRMTDLTVGLNWYLTPYLRMTSNYIRTFANRNSTTNTHTDTFGIRLGYEF